MNGKPKTISERLKETQAFVKASDETMQFILDVKEQMYKLYLRGDFDGGYTITQDRLAARIVFLDEQIDRKIELLLALKERYKKYGRRSPKNPEESNGTHTHTPAQKSKRNKIKIT